MSARIGTRLAPGAWGRMAGVAVMAAFVQILVACTTLHPAYMKGQELAGMREWEQAIEQMEIGRAHV